VSGTTKKGEKATERHPDSLQLVRQWAMIQLLADTTEPLSVKQLAEQLVTSKATVERDIATLEQTFALIEEPVGKQKKVYRIDKKVRALEAITFGTTELLAIYAAFSAMNSLAGTPIHDDLRSVMMKIRGFLSPRHNGGLDALAKVFAPHTRGSIDYATHHDQIDDLSDAIARCLVCQITYRAAGKDAERTHRARPLKLVWHKSALYLMACLGNHQRITTLAVHRIRGLEVTAEKFAQSRVDVEAHIEKAFGIFVSDQEEDVEVLFDAEIAWKLEERTYHPHETKERRPDGKLVYRVRSSAQWEIIPWVQSFGMFAELVAPVSWRKALRTNVEAMMARYTASTP
jgi:predicted DNA-binding transcriptional regulator YafY